MNITIDQGMQGIVFRNGGTDYPVKTLNFSSAATGGIAQKVWEENTGPDYSKEYLTLENMDNSSWRVTWEFGNYNNANSNYSEISWSKDKTNWTTYTSWYSGSNFRVDLSAGEKLYLKGIGTSYDQLQYSQARISFSYGPRIKVSGNLMSLIYGDNFVGQTTLTGSSNFYNFFYGRTEIVDAGDLVLPLELTIRCLSQFFYNCSNLTVAPVFPRNMVINAQMACSWMFYNCTKLNYVKGLFLTFGGYLALGNWLNGVSSTGTFVKSTGATWSDTGPSGVPSGWTIQYE